VLDGLSGVKLKRGEPTRVDLVSVDLILVGGAH
jgi:hypothetical protein